MDVPKFLETIKNVQINLLDYLDSNFDVEEHLRFLTNGLENIMTNQHNLRLFLCLLVKVANNHIHKANFYGKIEEIIQFLKAKMTQYYSNSDLINIFISNKRILLYLIKEGIVNVDCCFVEKIFTNKYINCDYPSYFWPEIKTLIPENSRISKEYKYFIEKIAKEVHENFEVNRLNGENESRLSEMIRNDSIDEFITYVSSAEKFSLDSSINTSIYETNSLLMKRSRVKLIEYAAFFGSTQIFQYLGLSDVKMSPSLWQFAVHSNNIELIHLLEDNHVECKDELCLKCLNESIKCHLNSITDYILKNLFQDQNEAKKFLVLKSIKYFNFALMENETFSQNNLYYLCRYNYYFAVKKLIDEKKININEITISDKLIIQFHFFKLNTIQNQINQLR